MPIILPMVSGFAASGMGARDECALLLRSTQPCSGQRSLAQANAAPSRSMCAVCSFAWRENPGIFVMANPLLGAVLPNRGAKSPGIFVIANPFDHGVRASGLGGRLRGGCERRRNRAAITADSSFAIFASVLHGLVGGAERVNYTGTLESVMNRKGMSWPIPTSW